MANTLQQFKKKALAQPGVHVAYDDLSEEIAFLDEVLKARSKSGLTQAEVVDRMGTTQSAVAHLESAKIVAHATSKYCRWW